MGLSHLHCHQTWLTPAAGAIVDRFGPRRGPSLMIAAGGVLVGPGWVINAYADTLPIIYWRRDHRHRRRRDLCRLRRQRGEMVSRSPRMLLEWAAERGCRVGLLNAAG
jgi:hypothetical protein